MAITVLRPNANAAGSQQWTREPATGFLYDKVNDDNPATYAKNPGNNSVTKFAFPDVVMTANQRVNRVRLRVRHQFTGSGSSQYTLIRIGEIAGRSITSATSSPVSVTTKESGWWTVDGSGQEYTETAIRDLSVRLHEMGSAKSNGDRIRVHEVYVDVDVNDQPVVSAAAASSTTTSRPSISWTYADADLDPQVAYEVRVYEPSVYNQAGFDPNLLRFTNPRGAGGVPLFPYLWSSLVAASDDTTVQVGRDLHSGVAYRAYVRAAQNFNGDYWWAEWDSVDFTPLYVPPPPVEATLTVDNTQARTLIATTGRYNMELAFDSDLEGGSTNWQSDLNCTGSLSTTVAKDGIQSFRLSSTASGDMRAKHGTSTGVEPGQTFSGVVYVRAGASSRAVRLDLKFWNEAASVTTGTITGPTRWDNTTGWIPLTCSGTVPAGSARWQPLVTVLGTGGAAELHYLDQAAFFVGNAIPANQLAGTNSDFETTVGSWANSVNATVTRSTAQKLNGAASLAVTAIATTNMSVASGSQAVMPGQTYSARAWVRANTTGRSVRLGIDWFDWAGAVLPSSTGTLITDTTTTWVSPTLSGVAPAGARTAVLYVVVNAPAAGEVHYVDDVLWTVGPEDYGWSWGSGVGGATDIQQVIEYQDVFGPNFLPANVADGGDSERTTMGWSKRATADTLAPTTAYVWAGERSMAWTPAATSSILDLGTALDIGGLTAATPVARGEAMVCSAWVRSASGSFNFDLFATAVDRSGHTVGTNRQSTFTATTTWQRVWVALHEADTTAGSFLRVGFIPSAGAIGNQLIIDGVQVELAANPTDTPSTWKPGASERANAWSPVRGTPLVPGEVRNDQFWTYDYEVKRGQAIRIYRAYNSISSPDGLTSIASAPTYFTVWQHPDGTWWLKDPDDAGNNMQPVVRDTIGMDLKEDAAEFHPFGRSFPVVVSDFVARGGRLEFYTEGQAEWARLEQLLLAQRPLFLQSGSGSLNIYTRLSDRSWERRGGAGNLPYGDGNLRRYVQVSYIEVEPD